MTSARHSIRVRLLLGFAAVVAVLGVGSIAALVSADRARMAEQARAATFEELSRIAILDQRIALGRRMLANYLHTGAAPDRDAFQAAAAELAAALPAATSAPVGLHQNLPQMTEAARAAIAGQGEAASALNNAMGTLLNSITALGEVANRAGGPSAQTMQRIYAEVATCAMAVGHAGQGYVRFDELLSGAVGKIAAMLGELDQTEGATPRLKRMAAVTLQAQAKVVEAQTAIMAAAEARTVAVGALDTGLHDLASTMAGRRAEAETHFQAASAAAAAAASLQRRLLAAGTAIGTVLSLLLAVLIGRAITRPLLALQAAMDRIAQGDLGSPVPGLARRDEIGDMARTVGLLCEGARRVKTLEAEAQADRIAAENHRRSDMLAVADDFERTVGSVARQLGVATTGLEQLAGTLRVTAGRSRAEAKAASLSAAGASDNVQTMATAAQQMAVSVMEISNQVAATAQAARRTLTAADATSATVASLADAADRIGSVVHLIGGLASQTNLLALNATIESARAGDAGKGFAVVAGEVKALAGQTTKATSDISAQVVAIRDATAKAVEGIRSIVEVATAADDTTAAIAAAVEQQSAATQEIARSAVAAASGTGDVSARVDALSREAEHTTGALADLHGANAEVVRQGDVLHVQLETLLGRLRAA